MKDFFVDVFNFNFFKSTSAIHVYFSLFCKVVTSLMFLACVPLAIRSMGAADYGVTAFFLTMHASVGLLDSGFTYAFGLRYTRQLVHDEYKAFQIFHTALPIYFSLSIMAIIGFALFRNTLSQMAFNSTEYGTEMLLFGFIMGLTAIDSLLGAVLQAHEKINQITVGRLLLDLVKVFGVVVLALKVSDAASIIWYILLSTIIKLVYDLIYIRKIINKFKWIFDLSEIKSTLILALPSIAIAIVSLLSTMLDKFLVSGKISSSAFTSYSFAVDLTTKSYFLMYAIINVIYPKLIKNHSLGHKSSKLMLIHFCALLIICLGFYIPLSLFSESITFFLIGQNLVEPTSTLIKLCSIAAVLYLLYTIIETQLYTRGHITRSLIVHVVGLLCFIYFLDYFVDKYQLYGVAIATISMHVVKIVLGSIMMNQRFDRKTQD